MTADARQLDAFVSPSRVGGLLEVARDEMLERAERGEPVAWVAVGDAGTVLHGWLATLIRRHAGGAPELWRIVRLGSGQKVRAWTTAELTKALTRAEAMLDPDSPRCLHERRHMPIFQPPIHTTTRVGGRRA